MNLKHYYLVQTLDLRSWTTIIELLISRMSRSFSPFKKAYIILMDSHVGLSDRRLTY